MATLHEATVGEMVANRPGLTRVFERFGIDYCCGGTRTLADAAARAGADYQAVLAALQADHPSAGAFDPAAHGERHPELGQVRRVFVAVAADLVQHMAKEETILFPAIVRLERDGRHPARPGRHAENNVLFPRAVRRDRRAGAEPAVTCAAPPHAAVRNGATRGAGHAAQRRHRPG
jgi:iron-sulfur cluster repair protein YtfE (RIC family)